MTDEDKNKIEPKEPSKEPSKEKTPAPIPYERFQEVNEKTKMLESSVSALTEKLTAYEKAIKAQEEEKQKALEAAEKEKLTTVELLQLQIGELQSGLETEKEKRTKAEEEQLRVRIATKYNIPLQLVGRLQGSTAEELAEDAQGLQQFLKDEKSPPGSPPQPRGQKPAGSFELDGKSPAEIREAMQKGEF
jgi:hypothetical protein